MKMRYLFVLIVMAFSNSFTNTLQLPEEVPLPNFESYYDSSATVAIPKFFPIGWSKKGTFAYVSSFYSDATAKTEVTLIVLDLKTDSLLSYLSEEVDSDTASAVTAFWKSNSDTIATLMNTYAVVMNKAAISAFPYNYTEGIMTIEIVNVCNSKDVVVESLTKADTVKIIAHTGTGSKLLGSYISTFLCGTVETAGVIKSPYEQRVAVVLTSWSPGWEGPPRTVSVMIRGCHLSKGWFVH